MRFEDIRVGDELIITSDCDFYFKKYRPEIAKYSSKGTLLTVTYKDVFSNPPYIVVEIDECEVVTIFSDEVHALDYPQDKPSLTLTEIMQLHMEIEDNLRENTINLMLDQRDFKSLKRYVY